MTEHTNMNPRVTRFPVSGMEVTPLQDHPVLPFPCEAQSISAPDTSYHWRPVSPDGRAQ